MAINFKLSSFDLVDLAKPGPSLTYGFLQERLRILTTTQADLIEFGLGEGFTSVQSRGVLEDLFRTFTSEWMLYFFIGRTDNWRLALVNGRDGPSLSIVCCSGSQASF